VRLTEDSLATCNQRRCGCTPAMRTGVRARAANNWTGKLVAPVNGSKSLLVAGEAGKQAGRQAGRQEDRRRTMFCFLLFSLDGDNHPSRE
jgi:hypothetical protein